MNNRGAFNSAAEFLTDRRDWLEVAAIEVEPGAYDVVLKVDGTYFEKSAALQVAESFARDIKWLLRNDASVTPGTRP
ncbi:hypothetical protein GS504_20720 [Rhodococcus hoagii]|nr:hypothetical protein [Prescottella equi]NKS59875.1 hypothetical protein [Prescottella equi]NKS70684.1 hypothetical protein [Prescottella equi]